MSKDSSETPELPAGFVPGEHDVVIGKGKKFYFHTGNQWLRTLVSSMLEEYKQAQTKSDKSNIISDVVEYVRTNGRFVKRCLKTGKWVYAEPLLCREKCSQTFRDNLAETYRSSNVAKRNKRRAEQQEKKRNGGMPDAKRMRVNGRGVAQAPPASHPGMMPALGAGTATVGNVGGVPFQQQQATGQQAQPIPSNLFDLEMPIWSPKPAANLLNNGLDFNALTRGSITGTAGADNSNANNGAGGLNLNLSNLNNLNANNFNTAQFVNQTNANNNTNTAVPAPAPAFQLSGLSSVNLLQNLPDILNNLSQIAAGNNAAPAPAINDTNNSNNVVNPFEPTPFTNTATSTDGTSGLPPLLGNLDQQGSASMPPPLTGGLGDHNNNTTGNFFEPRPIGGEKRHSLALGLNDIDWLRNMNANANSNATGGGTDDQATNAFNPTISAAFAA